jgi:GTP-binding protein EngB required for normal cell division
METFINKNNKYIFAEDFVNAYNVNIGKLAHKNSAIHNMNIGGLAHSLGTQLSIKKDSGKVKVAVSVQALSEYVGQLIRQANCSSNGYYLARAALFARTMKETGLMEESGFYDDGKTERFVDIPGYNTARLVPSLKKEIVADDEISSEEKIESVQLPASSKKKERKVQKKRVLKTSREKIEEAMQRIKQRNERTRKQNAKDMAIIKAESEKLAQCAEYVQKAAEIFAA